MKSSGCLLIEAFANIDKHIVFYHHEILSVCITLWSPKWSHCIFNWLRLDDVYIISSVYWVTMGSGNKLIWNIHSWINAMLPDDTHTHIQCSVNWAIMVQVMVWSHEKMHLETCLQNVSHLMSAPAYHLIQNVSPHDLTVYYHHELLSVCVTLWSLKLSNYIANWLRLDDCIFIVSINWVTIGAGNKLIWNIYL